MLHNRNLPEGWGHAYKCCGIPKYPAEYHFVMSEPIEISEEEDFERKKRLNKFLKEYGLNLNKE